MHQLFDIGRDQVGPALQHVDAKDGAPGMADKHNLVLAQPSAEELGSAGPHISFAVIFSPSALDDPCHIMRTNKEQEEGILCNGRIVIAPLHAMPNGIFLCEYGLPATSSDFNANTTTCAAGLTPISELAGGGM